MPFFDKFKKSKGTTSRFTKSFEPKTTPTLPPPEQPHVPERTTASGPKREEQSEGPADIINETLNPTPPATRTLLKKPTPKAEDGQEITEPHTTSSTDKQGGVDNIYHILWRPENGYNMIPTRQPRTNTYVPNAIAMFRLLEAAEERINSSKHIQSHEPNYMPYAVKVYYAVMFYLQVLWARKEAGAADGFEISLLKRFEAKYPKNGLPCAEIVYAYFNTVASCELADAKYDWIVPRVAPGVLSAEMHDINADDGSIYLQPMVPFMIGNLVQFIHTPRANYNALIDDENVFRAIDLQPAAHAQISAYGVNFHDNTAANDAFKPVFSSCGLSTPFTFGNENYVSAASYARRSDFGHDVKTAVTAGPTQNGSGNLVTDIEIDTIDKFLNMPKSSDLRWFAYLKEQAIIHARFFDSVYHFSDVQTTAGLEVTILTRLRIETNQVNNLFLEHKDRVGFRAQHAPIWYPRVLRNLNAGFATSRAGVRRNEELQALTFGTNATLPIRQDAAHAVDDIHPPLGAGLYNGNYWNNKEWVREMFWEDTLSGKPMFTDHTSAALRCYREKPHGTGIVDNEF
jgi:hypothetical protein